MSDLSYDIKIRSVEARRGVKGTIISYRLTWRVDSRIWQETFRTRAQADSYRSKLLSAARSGEPFAVESGRPLAWSPKPERSSWFSFTLRFTEVKWPLVSPGHRRGIAESLTDATEALYTREAPFPRTVVRAAQQWAYSNRIRDRQTTPDQFSDVLEWLDSNTVRMDGFRDKVRAADLARGILRRISQTQQGEPAASSTATRKRMVILNAFEYACELGMITDNPLEHVRWTKARTTNSVDPRVVINSDQARRFLEAVGGQSDRDRHYRAFFALMYYAALRPEEATELRRSQLDLPDSQVRWGELRLHHALPRSGSRWTNTGEIRERAALKHRATGDSRTVPLHPDLVTILRAHLNEYGPRDPEARLFRGRHGGPVTDRTYLRVFHEARAAAFTDREAASPLMNRPYSLRHAAVSTWLRTTGDAALVARWAGHSVGVLLTVYAKCVDGMEAESLERIWNATRRGPETPSPGNV